MKAFVVSALLLRTIDAQGLDLAGLLGGLQSPAPLLVPGPSAPAEADLFPPTPSDTLGTPSFVGASAADTADSGLTDGTDLFAAPLPVGTADVVLEPTTVDDPFGTSAGNGVSFDGQNFVWPTSSAGADAVSGFATAPPAIDDFGSLDTDTLDANPPDIFEDGTEVGSAEPDFSFDDLATATDVFADAPTDITEPDWSIDATPTDDATGALATDDFAFPDFDATGGTFDSGLDAAAATSDDLFALPEATPFADIFGDDIILPGVDSSYSVPLADATASLADLAAPVVTPASGVDAQDASAQAAGFSNGWSGEDTSNYDGQDYGEDDESYDSSPKSDYDSGYEEECPSYCLKGAYDAYPPSYPQPDEYEDDSDYPMIRKVLRSLGRRQSSGRGFAAFQWPSAPKKKYDDECDEEDDVPGWLYKTSGKKPCKPKCPASCYKKPAVKPYPGKPTDDVYGSKPTEVYDPYGSSAVVYGSESTSVYEPYGSESTSVYEPYGSESTSIYEPYASGRPWTYKPDSYDTTETSTSTQTTFVTSVVTWDYPTDYGYSSAEPYPTDYPSESYPSESYPSESYPEDSYGAEYPGKKDYDGETLATICPKQCNPFDPAANKCDITSSCTTTGKGKYYCACRAGFRASAWNEKDFSKQFKFAGQPYVYTAEGVVCDKVCKDQTCTEVLSRPLCQ
ncbi:hypothetical protein FB567DRAFT_582327 [Paraphoma chrysanthemicola]|uniref:EGF-like domain-containing protein n=1 Tax=Paraphoma chrysanthemicola TaxID=798071 RepID=A0A8K0VVA7_9PLEO|nr:hypothetical protein FB567DRAFT_582327 [Paraphoma chrysanthemicola]